MMFSRFLKLVILVAPLTSYGQDVEKPKPVLKTEGVYTLRNIEVEATGKTALEARQIAFMNGQKLALKRLIGELASSEDLPKLPELSAEEIAAMISGVQVMPDTEKIFEGTYKAKLIIFFKPEPVRALLAKVNARLSENPIKSLVIVPIYHRGTEVLLWEDPNPWKDVWSLPSLKEEMYRLVLPLGDLSDIQALTKQDIVQQKVSTLQAFAKKYGTEGIVVISAEPSDPEHKNLVITLNNYDFEQHVDVKTVTIPNTKAGPLEDLFPEAAKKVLSSIREGWKQKSLVDMTQKNFIKLTIPLKDIQDWVKLQAVLKGTPNVVQFDTLSLSASEVVLKLWFMGTIKQLNVGLTARNLEAVQSYDGYMLLPYKTNA